MVKMMTLNIPDMLKMHKSSGNDEIRLFCNNGYGFEVLWTKAENQGFLAAIIEIGSLIIVFVLKTSPVKFLDT